MGWDMERAEDEYWEQQAQIIPPSRMDKLVRPQQAFDQERIIERRKEKARILAELYGSKWADEKQVAEVSGVKFHHHGTITGRINAVRHLPPYDYVVHSNGRIVTREGKEVGNVNEYELDIFQGRTAHNYASPADPSQDLSVRIARLEAQKAELERQKAFIDSLPKEPGLPIDGEENNLNPVVHFKLQFSPTGPEYDYVVVRADNNLWYTSGPKTPSGYTWAELLVWLLEHSPNLELPKMKVSYIEDWADLTADGIGHKS